MEILAPFLLVGLFIGGGFTLLILIFVHHAGSAQRRRQELQAYAAHREWEYRETDPSLPGRFSGSPFGRGSGRRASNVFLGRHDGRPFTAFDYRYRTNAGSGNSSSSTHHFSIVALHIGVHTPPLEVGPFGTMAKLWDKLVRSDVPVGNPAFDQAFRVKTTAPEFARDVLHPGMQHLLWQNPGLSWHFEGDSMLVVEPGDHDPHQVEAKLHFMDAVLDAVPPHVWDRLRGELR
jgi:hypothetical protein